MQESSVAKAGWQANLGPAAAPSTIRVRCSEFALAAIHGLSLLDEEVKKLQTQQGQKRPADIYAIHEIVLYIARNLERCLHLARLTEHPALKLVAHVEAAIARDDLPTAASPLLADSPPGKALRPELKRLSQLRDEYELPLPSHPGCLSSPSAPRPGADHLTLMRDACLPGACPIPVLGFGTGIFYCGPEAVRESIRHAAQALGYVHFDCAQGYHNEELVGEALRASGVPRPRLFIATKLSDPSCMHTESAVVRTVENQIRMLTGESGGHGYLDVYYVHMDFFTPVGGGTPSGQLGIEAEGRVWRTLERLHAAGKLRALGVCNYSVGALERLWRFARVKPSVLQCKFDPYHPGYQRLGRQPHEQTDVVGWAQDHGMSVVAYSTLSGWPYTLRAVDDPHVAAIAKECGQSAAAVLLRHAIQHGLAVIPSSSNTERLRSNREALGFELDEAMMRRLDGLAHLLCPVPRAPKFRADTFESILRGEAAKPQGTPSRASKPAHAGKPAVASKPEAVSNADAKGPSGGGGSADAAAGRPYPDYLVGGQLERRRWDDSKVVELMRRGLPLILTGGCPLASELVGRWSFAHLADAAGDANRAHPVHQAPWRTSAFSYFSYWVKSAPQAKGMSIHQFVRRVAQAEAAAGGGDDGDCDDASMGRSRYYLHSALSWRDNGEADGGGAGNGSSSRRPIGGYLDAASPGQKEAGARAAGGGSGRRLAHAQMGPALKEDLAERVGWRWAASALSACGATCVTGSSLWMGHGRGCTPLHFDGGSGLLAQIKGRKRVLTFLPSQTARLYPYPAGSEKDTYSQLDLESIDLERHPDTRRARGLEGILEPGDVLFLPANVWHYIRQLGPGEENISLSFGVEDGRMELPMDPALAPSLEQVIAAAAQGAAAAAAGDDLRRADDAVIEGAYDDGGLRCMLAARWAEEQAMERTGSLAKGGRLLTALAAGADAATMSPAGRTFADVIGPVNSESHLMATRLRFELMGYVGSGAIANAVLRAATRDGRLLGESRS